ncbi:MAG: nucleoside hydrolase [Conexivisphaerales archaeon]
MAIGTYMLRLLIDTDTAGDDTTALMLALKSSNAKVEAITINCGNVNFDQQVENALYTVEVAGKSGKVPVYAGARFPLLKSWRTVEEVHGKDGMGNSYFPKPAQKPENKHAVDAIVELINDNPDEITVIEQAPMTNLALALRKDPAIAKKVKQIFFMGGSNQYLGNVTPAAEFNFWVDPDAAKIVLHSGAKMTMVGWEICMKYGLLTREEIKKIQELHTKESEFFMKVNRVARAFMKRVTGQDVISCPDSITVAMVLDPRIATSIKAKYVDVENASELTRGASIVDHLGITGLKANVDVVYEASKEKFFEMLYRMLKGERY